MPLFFLFLSCQRDSTFQKADNHSKDSGVTVKEVSGSEVKNKSRLFSEIQAINQSGKSAFGKSGKQEKSTWSQRFKIFYGQGREIIDGSYHSYTFPLMLRNPNQKPKYVSNVIFSEHRDGSFLIRVIHYNFTRSQIEALENGKWPHGKASAVFYDLNENYEPYSVPCEGCDPPCVPLPEMPCFGPIGISTGGWGSDDEGSDDEGSNSEEGNVSIIHKKRSDGAGSNGDSGSGTDSPGQETGDGNGSGPGNNSGSPGNGWGSDSPGGGYGTHIGVVFHPPGGGGGGPNPGSGGYPGGPGNSGPGDPDNNDSPPVIKPGDCLMEGGCVETQPISLQEALIESIKETLGLAFYSDEYDWLSEQATLDQLQEIAEFFEENGKSAQTKERVKNIIEAHLNGSLITAFPFFKFPDNSNYATQYPAFTEYVKNKIPQITNNTFIVNNIAQYSNLSTQEIKKDLQWGEGPVIKIKELDNACFSCSSSVYGLFDPNNPNMLFIDIDLVQNLENAAGTQLGNAFAFLIGVTILHEYVHFGGGNENATELFEQDTYGQTVWRNNAKIILKNNT